METAPSTNYADLALRASIARFGHSMDELAEHVSVTAEHVKHLLHTPERVKANVKAQLFQYKIMALDTKVMIEESFKNNPMPFVAAVALFGYWLGVRIESRREF